MFIGSKFIELSEYQNRIKKSLFVLKLHVVKVRWYFLNFDTLKLRHVVTMATTVSSF